MRPNGNSHLEFLLRQQYNHQKCVGFLSTIPTINLFFHSSKLVFDAITGQIERGQLS